MSQQFAVRRRQRADSDDDHRRTSSGSGKRQRGNDGNATDTPENEYADGSSTGQSGHQPGSIVRVSITNFVTYEKAAFYPGPSLNMVIGPNGTGKSSLVCAICLGLGWGPKNLGRAEDYGSFIKHGKKDATIETELKGKSDDHPNHIIKVQITGDKRKFWIDGKDANLQKVNALTKELSIQIDNLCQFLPQDKVSEFAAMNSKELLYSTQRAAADPEMLEWHDELIKARQEQKVVQTKHDSNQASLELFQKKRDGLQDDIDTLRDLANAQKKMEKLKLAKPYVEYRIRVKEWRALVVRRKEADREFKDVQDLVEPTLEATNEKQEYQHDIDKVRKERIKLLKDAETAVTKVVADLEAADESIEHVKQSIDAEQAGEATRRKAVQDIERSLTKLRSQQGNPPDFDGPEWNRRIKAEGDNGKAIANQIKDLEDQKAGLRNDGSTLRAAVQQTRFHLSEMESQAGRQKSRLSQQSKDTATAYEWILEHQNDGTFEQEIYGPPLITCKIKEGKEQYLDAVESVLNHSLMLSFTTQNRNDYRKLISVCRDHLKLSETYIKSSTQHINAYRSPLNDQQLEDYGLEGFVRDFIDGPAPVLAMMCDNAKIHVTGITLKTISPAQQQYLMAENSPMSSWIAGGISYRTIRRREYGPGAVSTSANNVNAARWWTEQPVDTSARQALLAKCEEDKARLEEMKAKNAELQASIEDLSREKSTSDEKRKQLESEKNVLQKEKTRYDTLPALIDKEEKKMLQRKQMAAEVREKIQNLRFEQNEAMLKKAAIAFRYKDKLVKLRQSREELLEAEIRFIEAKSDFETLTRENRELTEQLQAARVLLDQATTQATDAKEKAKEMLETIQEIQSDLVEGSEEQQYLESLPEDLELEKLEAEIHAEEIFIETNYTSNPNARNDYEKYQSNITKYEGQLARSGEKLEELAAQITELKEKWEPALDELVSNISDAFSYNFQQIGCAGEVGIHKDENFDEWALEIKVKFREEEELQQLDAHRQSGGERSVSTIFFLMSLQSMARAPFRVVDEINQGMDPRNERMVHERMVDIACKEHTSQYFLITPKLLPNLRYDPRMRVLCIASGEYMPQNHEMVSVSKAIAIKRSLIAGAA